MRGCSPVDAQLIVVRLQLKPTKQHYSLGGFWTKTKPVNSLKVWVPKRKGAEEERLVVIAVVEAVTWAPGRGIVGKAEILDSRGWTERSGRSTSSPFLVDWVTESDGRGLNTAKVYEVDLYFEVWGSVSERFLTFYSLRSCFLLYFVQFLETLVSVFVCFLGVFSPVVYVVYF